MDDQTVARRMMAAGSFADQIDLPANQTPEWAEAMRIAKLHARVFGTEAGQELLEHWIRVFLLRPIVRPNTDVRADGIREGQANVVRQLLMQLEIARRGPD